jgi:hypothetical protein
MNLLPRRSDYIDARRNNNNNNNNNNGVTSRRNQSRGRTALDAILDAGSDDSSNDEDEQPPPVMDWSANWIRRVNDGVKMLYFELDSTRIWMILLLEGSLINMIMENQQEAYHL